MDSGNTKRYEPWEELPQKNLDKVKKLTEATHKAINNIEVNLATDVIKVPGQNWVCVSFVSPDGNQKSKQMGMKIRGVFDQHSEAVEHVKRLIRLDPAFDIYVCEMYNWCLIPPDPEMINDQTYQNEELNKIIGEYRKNQIYAKEHFEERKRELMEQAADEARRAALASLEEETPEQVINESEVSPSDLMNSMMGECVISDKTESTVQ
jgi:excinuclease UvrABC nuclease subunit